jgi:hypothetical protein
VTTNDKERLADEARLGQEAFDRHVKSKLRPEVDGKFVAVDLQSGTYEIDSDDYQATDRPIKRLPGARIWLLRAGQPTTYRIVRLGQEGAA